MQNIGTLRAVRKQVLCHAPAVECTNHMHSDLGAIIDQLLLVWGASEAEEYRDVLLYLPLTD